MRQGPQAVQNVVTCDVVINAPNADLLLKPGMDMPLLRWRVDFCFLRPLACSSAIARSERRRGFDGIEALRHE
jgi:hypothetical protein